MCIYCSASIHKFSGTFSLVSIRLKCRVDTHSTTKNRNFSAISYTIVLTAQRKANNFFYLRLSLFLLCTIRFSLTNKYAHAHPVCSFEKEIIVDRNKTEKKTNSSSSSRTRTEYPIPIHKHSQPYLLLTWHRTLSYFLLHQKLVNSKTHMHAHRKI